MKRSRLFVVAALFTSFGWLLAGGCSSADSALDPSMGGSAGSGGSQGDAPTDGTVVTPDASGSEGGAGNPLSPLCGTGECLPDRAEACASYIPPEAGAGGVGSGQGGRGGGGMAGEGGVPAGGAGAEHGGGASGAGPNGGEGAGGIDGESGAGGADGAGGDGAAGQGGADGAVGGSPGSGATTGVGATAGTGVGAAPSVPPSYGCQVARRDNRAVTQCEVAGFGKENAPCFSAADCAAGLACVTEGEAGRCLPYCCSAATTCTSGTYCAERQLRTGAGNRTDVAAPTVPVCVPADDCSLEDEFPCPSGRECRCKNGTACMVVRGDGTTTCLVPGEGQAGDACPCAWNHVCSSVTNLCVKICHIDPARADCGNQKCQASSELPQSFGVCVGPLK